MSESPTNEPREPYAWLLLVGRHDLFHPPFVLHEEKEIASLVKEWRKERSSHWPQIPYQFSICWSVGKICFHASHVENNAPVDGFLFYGICPPFEKEVALQELSSLGALLSTRFGQPYVELHLVSEIYKLRRNRTEEEKLT